MSWELRERRHERYSFFRKVSWDFFTGNTGRKSGYILNISSSGCLLKASDPIDHRRWIRIVIQDHSTNLYFTQIGRIVRREDIVESLSLDADEHDITLHRYGIEFTHPGYLSENPEMIAALSQRSVSVRSFLDLTSTEAEALPGSLA